MVDTVGIGIRVAPKVDTGSLPPADTPARKQAREVAESFEALFLNQVVGIMSQGLKTDGPFGGGKSEETWRGLLNEQYGAAIAKTGGIGIADHIYRQLINLQEAE